MIESVATSTVVHPQLNAASTTIVLSSRSVALLTVGSWIDICPKRCKRISAPIVERVFDSEMYTKRNANDLNERGSGDSPEFPIYKT